MPSIAHITGAALAMIATGVASPALAGPDFITPDRTNPLAASDARREQQPMDDIVFALDAADLGPTALTQLDAVARWLRAHPDNRVVIEGRADSSGTAAYNTDLAARRAQVAGNQLIADGVDPDRVVLVIYGENGARRQPDPLDRRVVMFATTAPLPQLVSAELDRNAIEVTWTHLGTRLRETRGITPIARR